MEIDNEERGAPRKETSSYEAPPPRDRLPTLPEDLSEYAWLNTGPQSWSADGLERELDASDLEDDDSDDDNDSDSDNDEEDCWIDEMSAGLLVDLWHNDVPQVLSHDTAIIDEREAHVVSLMDGSTTVGMLLESSRLPVVDVLGTLCELCARGVVMLDRSRRVSQPPQPQP